MTGYHDPVTVRDLQEQLAVERAENGRLRAEMDRLRAVWEAAKAWRPKTPNPCWDRSKPGECKHKTCALIAAIDSALSASGEKEKT